MINDDRLIWLGGELIPSDKAMINVLSPTSQFGSNVFEGIRCYWNEERKELNAFRLDDHYDRLEKSIKLFQLDNKYTRDDFKQALIDVVRANKYEEDIAVRQTLFVDGIGGTWHTKGPVNMFVSPIKKCRKVFGETSLKCSISSWERISDKNMSPRAKIGANYINSRLGHLEAIENGFDTCIFLNNNGKISEGPGSCLFIIRDGVLITPTLTSSVLESITRDTIIEIARNILKIPVEIREVDRTELYIADEAFLCGSAMEIEPIRKIDAYKINEDYKNSISQKIHYIYIELVTGRNLNYAKWLCKIQESV